MLHIKVVETTSNDLDFASPWSQETPNQSIDEGQGMELKRMWTVKDRFKIVIERYLAHEKLKE